VLLTDAGSGTPVPLDYRTDTNLALDAAHRITGVELTLPRGTALPKHVRAYVMVDAFPIGQRVL